MKWEWTNVFRWANTSTGQLTSALVAEEWFDFFGKRLCYTDTITMKPFITLVAGSVDKTNVKNGWNIEIYRAFFKNQAYIMNRLVFVDRHTQYSFLLLLLWLLCTLPLLVCFWANFSWLKSIFTLLTEPSIRVYGASRSLFEFLLFSN